MWFWPYNCVQNVNWKNGTCDTLSYLRNFRVTAQENHCKYYNCDDDCYLLDKMPCISPIAWDDITEPQERVFNDRNRYLNNDDVDYIENRKWFTPKDNDFEEECKRDEEIKAKILALEKKAKEMEERYQQDIKQIYKKYNNCYPGTNIIRNRIR